MALLSIRFDPLTSQTAALAGQLWRERRLRSKQPRDRVIADFLIGAHALLQADALLTRDRGFYRQYFTDLQVIQP